jgi:hypothetical protein
MEFRFPGHEGIPSAWELERIAPGTRNNAAQVSVEVADNLSLAESISGKQWWLLEAIRTMLG